MTLITAWIGVDPHGPTSVYIAGDSQINWGIKKFDYARKVFASNRYPELFAFAGDVVFPSIALSQLVTMIDSGLLINDTHSIAEKYKLVRESITRAFSSYPTGSDVFRSTTNILYLTRDTEFVGYPRFYGYYMTANPDKKWKFKQLVIPEKSGLLAAFGYGRDIFMKNYEKYQEKGNSNTSRNVFHCFCDTLFHRDPPNCGGAPQLVGLYRKPGSVGKNFGIIFDKRRYLLGTTLKKVSYLQNIEWRNDLFQICDGNSMKPLAHAARQPDLLRGT